MSRRLFVWGAGSLALVLPAGCLTGRPAVPVGVTVRDAETHATVPGAEVRVAHMPVPPARDTISSPTVTGADGVAQVSTGRPTDGGEMLVQASARGYLTGFREVPPEGPTGAVVVDVFAEPRPTVELVFPVGYRGPVRVAVRTDDPGGPPGRRAFAAAVAPGGAAEVVGPPVLRLLFASDFRARYEGGPLLPPPAGVLDIGLRWVRTAGDVQYFVLGTQGDLAEAQRAAYPDDGHPPRAGGANPAGGGRRGGRGGGGRR